VVLCPNRQGSYYVGEVIDNYSYKPGEILPHRRNVKWYPATIDRTNMSTALRNSSGSIGTVSRITQYADEIETLIAGNSPPTIISTDETVEDASVFALEKHLEDFLVKNWKQTDLGKQYDRTTIKEKVVRNSIRKVLKDYGIEDELEVSKVFDLATNQYELK
jgi:restriction system protein